MLLSFLQLASPVGAASCQGPRAAGLGRRDAEELKRHIKKLGFQLPSFPALSQTPAALAARVLPLFSLLFPALSLAL